MIQMLKCTPNSNFKMEAEFENVPRSKVVEFEKLNNFHFLEIFNFFRKFGSNLKNGSSGSSVIISKIISTSLLTAGATRRSPPIGFHRFHAQ